MTTLAPLLAETVVTITGPMPVTPATDRRIPWWGHMLMLTPGVVAAGGIVFAVWGMK